MDKKAVGVPSLREYVFWLQRRIKNLGSNDPNPNVASESLMVAFRAQGAGGQNVNKVYSCIDITHNFTGITFQQDGDRDQIGNRSEAIKRMKPLVDEHLGVWLEYLTGNDSEVGKDIAKVLRGEKDKAYPEGKKNKRKREEVDKLCDILERKELEVSRPWDNAPEVLEAMKEFGQL